MTLEQANLKYKDVARITLITGDLGRVMFFVAQSEGYHHATYDDLEDAIEACRYLDNAEPADRQF